MSRSASRRELANTIELLCASIRSTMRSSTSGQMVLFSRLAMSGTGTCTDRSNVLAAVRRDDGGRRRPGQEPGDLLRRAGPSPTARSAARASSSSWSSRSSESARWAPRLVRRDGVHLVDDDGLHLGERLAGRRRQHQEQRLGRGDQDVGRLG